MNVLTEPKIDSHCHVLDPQRFPYAPDVAYEPQGQEIGTPDYFRHVMRAYGVQRALLVGAGLLTITRSDVSGALVSRLHCQLTATEESLQVKDLGSTNGTSTAARSTPRPRNRSREST